MKKIIQRLNQTINTYGVAISIVITVINIVIVSISIALSIIIKKQIALRKNDKQKTEQRYYHYDDTNKKGQAINPHCLFMPFSCTNKLHSLHSDFQSK